MHVVAKRHARTCPKAIKDRACTSASVAHLFLSVEAVEREPLERKRLSMLGKLRGRGEVGRRRERKEHAVSEIGGVLREA